MRGYKHYKHTFSAYYINFILNGPVKMKTQSPQTKISAFKCELWRDDEARSLYRFFTTRYVLRECVRVCLLQRLHTLLGNVFPSAAALVLPPGQIAALPVEWWSSTSMSVLLLRPSFRRRVEQSGAVVTTHEKYQPSSRAHGGERS